jgi:hypothetical protein
VGWGRPNDSYRKNNDIIHYFDLLIEGDETYLGISVSLLAPLIQLMIAPVFLLP